MKKESLNITIYTVSIMILLIAMIGYCFINIDNYIKGTKYINIENIQVIHYSDGYRFSPDVTDFKGYINEDEFYFRYYFYPYKSHYSTKIKDNDNISRYVSTTDFYGKGSKKDPIILLSINNDFYKWPNKDTIQQYLLMDKVYLGFFTLRGFCKIFIGILFICIFINLRRKI